MQIEIKTSRPLKTEEIKLFNCILNADHYQLPEEIILINAITKCAEEINIELAKYYPDYNKIIDDYAEILDKPLNNFLDNVLVNDENPLIRDSRVLLMRLISVIGLKIAEFSLLNTEGLPSTHPLSICKKNYIRSRNLSDWDNKL